MTSPRESLLGARYVDHYAGDRRQNWRTPRELFDGLDAEYGFTLDGASEPGNGLLAHASTVDDPLSWEGERVFCNPPWSGIPPFVELAAIADLAVLLVPARTNCRWFHRALDLGAARRVAARVSPHQAVDDQVGHRVRQAMVRQMQMLDLRDHRLRGTSVTGLPATLRPEPWAPAPDGFHFEATEQTGAHQLEWITPPIGKGTCRFTVERHHVCGKPAVATLMRRHGRGKAPWDYCADHLYGRWIEDGKVVGWRLVKDEA